MSAGYTIDSTGTTTAQLPPALMALSNTPFDPAAAEFITSIPWVLRTGARIISMEKGREKGDLELNVVYEAWGSAQGQGPQVHIPKLGTGMFEQDDINPVVQHHFHDTVGVRVGGAYNVDAGGGDTLTLRGGAFYDMSATDPAATRVDFDTLAKIGITAGVGYRLGAVTANLALAEIFDISRDVTDGDYAPINGTQHGLSVTHDGMTPLPPVNNGSYSGHMHVLSFGLTVQLDGLLGFDRKPVYLNDYEDPEGKTPQEKGEGDKDNKDKQKKEGDSLDKALSDESKDNPIEHIEDRPQKPAQTVQPDATAQPADTPPAAADPTPAPTPPPKKKPKKRKPKPKPQPQQQQQLQQKSNDLEL
jgi:hypothetical protein